MWSMFTSAGKGHEELVRCIRFDSKRIVSGAYDGYVSVVCI